MAAIDSTKLTYNGFIGATEEAILGVRERWTYTDTTRTIASMENDNAYQSDAMKLLHLGDLVNVVGSDGNVMAVVTSNKAAEPQDVDRHWFYLNSANLM